MVFYQELELNLNIIRILVFGSKRGINSIFVEPMTQLGFWKDIKMKKMGQMQIHSKHEDSKGMPTK